MVRAVEPLELPAATYQVLEQIARLHGTTPAGVVERLVQQFQLQENLPALRQEYQQLTDRELNRTITKEEEAHLEEICDQINAIEMQSEANLAWQSRTEEMNNLLQDLKHTLESFPDKKGAAK
jgi:cell shape-determining protein MreC